MRNQQELSPPAYAFGKKPKRKPPRKSSLVAPVKANMKLFNVVVIEGYGACSAIVAAKTLDGAKEIVSESKGMYEEYNGLNISDTD